MRANARMSRLLSAVRADAEEADVEETDAPEAFRAVAAEGWVVGRDGAQFLSALRAGYAGAGHGDGFRDVVRYEATVNGRGMMDHDLPLAGPKREALLVRRCLGYAYAALRTVPSSCAWPMFGYVSLSHGGVDDGALTANVTFCSRRADVLPYVGDVDAYGDEALLEIAAVDVVRR